MAGKKNSKCEGQVTSSTRRRAGSSRQGKVVAPAKERKRAGNQFFITLPLGGDVPTACIRPLVLHNLLYFCNVLLYCVSLEQGHTGTSSEYHIHIFVEFVEKFLLIEVSQYFRAIFNSAHLDVQSCKSRRNVLKYITKEDENCLTNCRISELSLRYQCFYYFSRMSTFSFSHHFIVEHRNNYKFLMNMYEEVRLKIKVGYSYIYPEVRIDYCWVNQIYNWWDEFNTTAYYYKKKHLYLYGPSNVGKSTVINNLILGLNELVFFAPSAKIAYPFDLFFSTYKCIIFEEFNYMNWDIDFIKKLIGGDIVTLNRKYCDNKKYRNELPIIIISNYKPPDSIEFLNRVHLVHADSPYFQVTSEDRFITITKDAFYVPSSPVSSEILSSPVI